MPNRIRQAVLAAIRPGEARPATTLASLSSGLQVEREQVVAVLWDLVEEGVLAYDALANFRRLV